MKILAAFAALAVALSGGQAAELTWLTDLAQAKAQAKAEHKLVLLNFTGSDWCPYCIKLDKQVLQSSEFADYATANLVLVLVDFPHSKPQPESVKKANEALLDKFDVTTYPTLVVLKDTGKKLGKIEGYDGSGPTHLLAKLEKWKTK